jgi:Flp pilus assembly protein TadG
VAHPHSNQAKTGARIASRRRSKGQRGSTAIEFALVMICLIPLFFGTVAMGVTIGRAQEAIQVTRDVGHMYGEGVDFTSQSAQQLVTQLAQGFDLSGTGDSVLIFSHITTVFQADCTAASVNPCTNLGLPVFTQRLTIGNTALKTSAFGTPGAGYLDSSGNITAQNYMQQSSLVANGFGSVITQSDGDVAYLVEGYFNMPDLSFLSSGFSGSSAAGGIYARAIF